MKCPHCNMENEENAKFCTSCGSRLNEDQGQAEDAAVKEDSAVPSEKSENPLMPDLTEGKIDWNNESNTEAESKEENAAELNTEAGLGMEAESAGVENTAPVIPAPVISDPISMEPPKKKKGLGIIIGVAAGIAVVGIAAAAFFGMQRKDPKTEVFDALSGVHTAEEVKPVDEIFGFTEIFTNAQKTNTDYGFGLTLEQDMMLGLDSFEGAGFDLFEKNDVENKVGSLDLGILYNGLNITNFKMYYDDTYIKAALPDIFSEVFVLNYADDLAGQIENSPYLGKYISLSGVDMEAFKSYLEYCMQLYDPNSEGPIDVVGLKERFDKENDSFETLKSSIKVEKISGKKTVKVDGKEVSCRGFDMIVPKENLLQFMDESCQFFLEDETLKQEMIEYYSQILNMSGQITDSSIYGDTAVYDGETLVNEMWTSMDEASTEVITALDSALDEEVKVTVYLDKKGRLISLETEAGLTSEDDSKAVLSLNVELNGGTYLTQNMTASFTIDSDGEKSVITFAKEGSYDEKTLTCDMDLGIESGDELIELAYSGSYDVKSGDYDLMLAGSDINNEMFKVSIAGVIDELEKGKGFRADADSIMISSSGMDMIELSGYYSIAPMDGEIEDLEGETFDLLAATESDYTSLIQSAYFNLLGLLGKFQQ